MFDPIARGIVPCTRSPAFGVRACTNAPPHVERIVLLVISNRIIPS
jgi:hypothetical protein